MKTAINDEKYSWWGLNVTMCMKMIYENIIMQWYDSRIQNKYFEKKLLISVYLKFYCNISLSLLLRYSIQFSITFSKLTFIQVQIAIYIY
jgi:hypothetical protein